MRLVLAAICLSVLTVGAAPAPAADASAQKQASHKRIEATPKKLDRSGKKRVGKASFYGKSFAGKKMAEHCPNCGGDLKIIAAILDTSVIDKTFTHLGLQARAPPPASARGQTLLHAA